MVGVIYYFEDDFILELNILNWIVVKRDVAKELIERLEVKGFKNDLLLFELGYLPKNMINFLGCNNLKYLMKI